MKKYIKSLLVIVAFLAACFSSYSQDKKHEFSISIGGPFSFVKATTIGQSVEGNGMNAGLRYSYYLNKGLSIGIGVEYQTYNSDFKFGSLGGQYDAVDAENESFEFRYKAANYREEQKLGYINVPIGIQFETPGTSKLYVAAGAKIGFASSGSYQSTISNLTTSGYYPQYNVELFGPAFAGFASTNNVETPEQDLNNKVSYSVTFETGLKQVISTRNSIYIGAYLDYGLNDIYDNNEAKNLVQYNPEIPVVLKYNSVSSSGFTTNGRLVSYGLKLRFALQ
ncbi:outer membrane beta-barrel protein [Flavobacterium sp. 2]|uniref:outer membrane beta-barrel protein n=1 Tax=Flavobacterium sp. 2 TaxID=308053 RepID=UPI003CEC517C